VLEGKSETCDHLVETLEAYDERAASSLAFHRQDLDADGSFQSIPLSAVQSCHLIGHCFALIGCERVSYGLTDDVFHQPSTLALPPPVLFLRRLVIDLLLQLPPPSQPPPPTSSVPGTLWRRRAVRLLMPILPGRRPQCSQLGVSVNFF